ncbi:renin receptor, partial [Patella vulgata]|uniref:renin receptor n=1 Tax=Patella vulgata TaxID=6465 RepID=UPI0024A95676
LNTQTGNEWKGISHTSIFKKPKANVLITLVTDNKHSSPVKLNNVASFPVLDDFLGISMEDVRNNLQRTFLDQDPLSLDMFTDTNLFDLQTENQFLRKLPNSLRMMKDRLLDSDSIIQKINPGSLNSSIGADSMLMGELQMIDDVLNTLKSNDKATKSKSPDLLSFTITGLHKVAEKHGASSDKTNDANKMVTDFIHHATDEFKKLYKDNVVVEVLTLTPQKGQIRKVRSLLASTEAPSTGGLKLNLADDYDENFPAMFNIVLWTMVILAIAVYIIIYGMWFIDPGRDSIIYRMTSQRLKKD